MLSFFYYSTFTRYTGDIPLISDALSSDNRLLGNTAILNEPHSNADTYPLSPTLPLSLSHSLLALSPVFRRGYALHYSMYFDRQSGTRRVLCATKLLLLLLRRFVSVCNSYTYVCAHYTHTFVFLWYMEYLYRYMDNCFQTAECISCLNYLQIISELCDHLVT